MMMILKIKIKIIKINDRKQRDDFFSFLHVFNQKCNQINNGYFKLNNNLACLKIAI